MIYVIATIEAQPGRVADLIAGAKPCIEATRREAGCISYDYVCDTEHENRVLVIERWASREALAAHMLMPHLSTWREIRKPMVKSARVEIIHAGQIETF
jgi:quinol monooxygenase YgiN